MAALKARILELEQQVGSMAQSNTGMLSNLAQSDAAAARLHETQIAKLTAELEQTKQTLQETRTNSERQIATLKSQLEDARVQYHMCWNE